jgi:hypothetical protein
MKETLQLQAEVDALCALALQKPIAYQRAFRKIAGSTVAAVFLSQCWYWLDKTVDGGWFYKTATEWEYETGLSRSEQTTARKQLLDKGVLEWVVKGVPKKTFYKIDVARIKELLVSPNAWDGADPVEVKSDNPNQPSKWLDKKTGRYITAPSETAETTVKLQFAGVQQINLTESSILIGRSPANQSDGVQHFTYIQEITALEEEQIFSENGISANGQESGGEAPPQPRPASSAYTHPIDKMAAHYARGKEATSYRQVKQWHLGNSSKIDPDFIAYLQRGDLISFIKAEPPSAERVEQWLSIANRTTPEGQDRLELATKAWYSFAHERDAIAARTAAKHKALHKNDPENNVAYRRFSEALEKTGKLRCVVQSFDHFGLRIVIEHKGKKLVTSHTFGRMSLTLLFTELRKVDTRWASEMALADRLGLREFYEMCSFEAVA